MGSDKITRKCHTQESQDLSPFPADDQMGARNSESSMIRSPEQKQTKRIHKRSITLERSVRVSLESLNMLDGTHLALISDVDKDTKMFGWHEKCLTY